MYSSAPLWQEFYRRLHAKARSLVDPVTHRVRADLVREVSCVVCGSSASRVMAEVDGFTYAECASCGFVFLNPQLRPETLAASYNDADVRTFFFRQLLLPHVEKDQEAEFIPRIRRIKALTGSDRPKLLDVGCAAGNFLALAAELGCSGEGLELNAEYVDFIRRERPGVTVRQELLEEAGFQDGTFDAVTLWDVLEHVPDPAAALRECARIVRPGGIVALTTINHACLNQKLLRSRWRYWMPPDHVCSFTPDILRSIMQKAGLTVAGMTHHPMFEVLADVAAPWLSSLSPSPAVRKLQKLLSLVLARPYQAILGLARSGDLLTVYAVKRSPNS